MCPNSTTQGLRLRAEQMKYPKIIYNIESLSCTGWGSRCVWSNKAPKQCLQNITFHWTNKWSPPWFSVNTSTDCDWPENCRPTPDQNWSIYINLLRWSCTLSALHCNQIILMDNFHHCIKKIYCVVLKFAEGTFIIFQLPDDYQYSWKVKLSGPSQQEMCHKSNNHQASHKRNVLKTWNILFLFLLFW